MKTFAYQIVAVMLSIFYACFAIAEERNVWYYDSGAKVISNEVWSLPVHSLSGGTLTLARTKTLIVGSGDLDLSNLFLRLANGNNLEITKLVLADGSNGSIFSSTVFESIKADDVSGVPTGCFKDNTSLTNLILSYHSSFNKKFSNDAFRGCTKLTCDINQFVPPWIVSIGSYCFNGSPLTGNLILTNVSTFAVNNVSTSSAFSATKLEEVVLKGTFTSLPSYLFYNCSELRYLCVDANITFIGTKVFQGCPEIQRLEFLGYKAFSLSTSSTAYNFLNSKKISSVTFNGLPLASADIDKILTGVTAVSSTDAKGKSCTIYASKRINDRGWSKLAAGFADKEPEYKPDNSFGVYRNGSRKAWLVHRRSCYDSLPTKFECR